MLCVALSNSPAIGQTLYDLTKVKFVTSNVVVAVGNSGVILRSANGGASWSAVASPTPYALRGLCFSDANNGWAVGGGNFTGTGTVIHTVNGGASWTLQSSTLPNTLRGVSFSSSLVGTAVGLGGLIVRTTNGGSTWTTQSSGTTFDLNGVAFTDDNTGWAVGYAGVFHTVNGGSTWTEQSSASGEQQVGVTFVSSSVGYSIGGYGEVQRTGSGGSSWSLQTEGIAAYNNDVAFFDANNGTIVAAAGIIVHTVNGGSNWATQTSGTGNYIGGIAFSSATIAVAVGGASTILRTTNGGSTWAQQTILAPPLSVSVSSAAVCSGGSATLTASPSGGTSPYTYSWTTGATTQSISVSAPAAYSVTVTDSKSVTASGSGTLTVNPRPTVSVNSAAVCSGGSASLTASPSGGTSPYTYSWNTGATTQSISASTAGTYSVTVTDSKGCAGSGSGTLTVNLPPAVTVNSLSVCGSISGTLSATVVGGSSPYSYSWNTGATTQSISASTAGTYSVTVTDSKGCTGSGSGVLTVNPKPILVCTGDSLTATKLTATTAVASTPSTGVSYSWSGTGLVSGGATASATWNQPGSKTVVVTTLTGCKDSCVSQVSQSLNAPPAAPTLASPVDGSTNLATNPTLSWSASTGATTYRLQCSPSSSFSTLVIDDSTLIATSRQVSSLSSNTRYYWRVNAKYSGGTTPYSTPWNFTTSLEVSKELSVGGRWNLVSVPVAAINRSAAALFPTSISRALAYDPVLGYIMPDTLANGAGYWLKFNTDQSVSLTGLPILNDTIRVAAGWNLIGSISDTLPVSAITSLPGGMVVSRFFRYDAGYKAADTIMPGGGYWVKVRQNGRLVLSSPLGPLAPTNSIRIVSSGEIPPPAPDADPSPTVVPASFVLNTGYPNPFNPATTISFSIPGHAHVQLRVFDVLGQLVQTLVDEEKEPGRYSVTWNAPGMPSGVYFCRMSAGDFVQTQKLVLAK